LKDALKNVVMVSLPSLAFVVLLLEVVFRTVIPASARPQAYLDPVTTLWKLDRTAQAEGLATIGRFAEQRGHWRINNEGWNSPIDYRPAKAGRRVAVIGDSFIEALQVDIERSYPNLLAESLDEDWDVYAFGVSGAPLSQYLHMARHVVPRFSPDVLVLNLVHNDFVESYADLPEGHAGVQWLRVANGPRGLEEVAPQPDFSASQYNRSKQLLKLSATVRYLYYNLAVENIWRPAVTGAEDAPATYNANVEVASAQRHVARIAALVRYVFGKLRAEQPDLRVIVVLDGPRPGVYGEPDPATDLSFIAHIVGEAAAVNGFEFVDLAEPMRAEFAASGVPFESRYDNHWDLRGHRFVAAQVLRAMQQ
jgi:hypothetical protein